MDETVRNLLTGFPSHPEGELFETLIENDNLRLERIVSTGQATPPGKWYDQDHDEWVMLVSGEAALLFEEQTEANVLRPGDHVLIRAHRKHRVEWTAQGRETVWLALHCGR